MMCVFVWQMEKDENDVMRICFHNTNMYIKKDEYRPHWTDHAQCAHHPFLFMFNASNFMAIMKWCDDHGFVCIVISWGIHQSNFKEIFCSLSTSFFLQNSKNQLVCYRITLNRMPTGMVRIVLFKISEYNFYCDTYKLFCRSVGSKSKWTNRIETIKWILNEPFLKERRK